MPDGTARGGRIVRAIAGYGIVAFALLQIIEPIMHGLHLPEATLTFFLIGLALVFPLVIAVSWTLDRLQLAAAGPADRASASQPWSTRILEWLYMPQTASIRPFTRATSGLAPNNTIGANSMVWAMTISSAWEREPTSQSTSGVAWAASCVRQRYLLRC